MKVVKIRTRKNYANASSHILIGSVVARDDVLVQVKCRTFHFKPPTLETEAIIQGSVSERIIPWSNVECINKLSDDFNWEKAALKKCDHGICLCDGKYETLVTRFKNTHQ